MADFAQHGLLYHNIEGLLVGHVLCASLEDTVLAGNLYFLPTITMEGGLPLTCQPKSQNIAPPPVDTRASTGGKGNKCLICPSC
eukprot:1151234-Pelagomonas_calceolata.AAC.4